jgi:hypothetical protein
VAQALQPRPPEDKKGVRMRCPFLDEGHLTRCRAVAGTLIPSLYEREQFCRSDGHVGCPTHRLFLVQREPLSQDAYYALWVPTAARPSSSL